MDQSNNPDLAPPSQPLEGQPSAPTDPATQAAPTATKPPASVRKALLIMFGPGIAIVATIIAYAVINFFLGAALEGSTLTSIGNALMFLVGTLAILAMLPCFIYGIILLARR